MSKDKEFKAKNRDLNFSKPQKDDTVLGRQNRPEEQKTDLSSSKKNRMYQQRQEAHEQPFDVPETKPDISESSVSDTVINNAENPVYEHSAFDTKETIPVHSESHTEQPKTAESVKGTQRKQAEKFRADNDNSISADNDVSVPKEHKAEEFPAETTDNISPGETTEMQTDIPVGTKDIQADMPPSAPKGERYNIQDAMHENKQAFDIVEKNTDFKLGRQEHTAPKGTQEKKGIKPKNKNRLYQKEHTKADEAAQSVSSEQSAEPETAKTEKSDKAENAENLDEEIPLQEDFQFDRTKKYEQRAERLHHKAEKAKKKAPHNTKIKRQRVYDEKKQKAKTRLQFENEAKPVSDNRYTFVKNSTTFASNRVLLKAHNKIREVERENSSVEAAHKTEEQAERLAAHSMRLQKNLSQKRKNAPIKKAQRLQEKAEKAEIKALYEKTLKEHPEIKKSEVKKFIQKQRIKKQYQKAKRAEQTAKKAKKAAQNTKAVTARIAAFVWRHKAVFGIILAIFLLFAWLGSVLTSCSIMGTQGGGSLMVSSYFAEDDDIYAAEDYYVALEQNLQNRIDNIENEYSGYDEYRYNVAGIGHNPYELISYLTAVYQDFKANEIEDELDALFNTQYHLRITQTSEQRTDSEGNTYTYKILNVTLTNSGFTTTLNADQQELYNIYLASKGNRDYLFADDIYSNVTQSPYNDYEIPSAALSDETFRKLITEAEKYLGYPYVWGGSSPSTSFDCSGFVCWVFKNSGVYPLSRTTAQGIFNQCTAVRPAEAKPGDIIFFTGTYNSGSPVSHVGIYVGNGMMIHCGNPIQYASVNSSYWSSHFYAYGRLN